MEAESLVCPSRLCWFVCHLIRNLYSCTEGVTSAVILLPQGESRAFFLAALFLASKQLSLVIWPSQSAVDYNRELQPVKIGIYEKLHCLVINSQWET